MMVGDSKDHTSRPSLIECSWRCQTPLSLLTREREMIRCIQPITFEEITDKLKRPTDDPYEVSCSTHHDANPPSLHFFRNVPSLRFFSSSMVAPPFSITFSTPPFRFFPSRPILSPPIRSPPLPLPAPLLPSFPSLPLLDPPLPSTSLCVWLIWLLLAARAFHQRDSCALRRDEARGSSLTSFTPPHRIPLIISAM